MVFSPYGVENTVTHCHPATFPMKTRRFCGVTVKIDCHPFFETVTPFREPLYT